MLPAIQVNDVVLKDVPPQRHDEFRQFLATGEASEDFKNYLDNSPECQRAVDRALEVQFAEVKALVPGKPESLGVQSSTRNKRGRGLLGIAASMLAGGALSFAILHWSQYQAFQERTDARQVEDRWASRSDRHPLEVLAQVETVLPKVTGWLNNDDPKVQEHARLVLMRIPPMLKEAVPQLAKSNKEAAEELRGNLVEIAGMIPSSPFPNNYDEDVRRLTALANSLEEPIGPSFEEIRNNLASVDRGVRLRALEKLAKLGPAAEWAVPDLIQRLRDKQTDAEERKVLADSLASISSEAAIKVVNKPAGVGMLFTDAIYIREWQGELKAPDVGSRIRAAKELAALGARAQVASEELSLAYQREKDPWARWEMESALKQISPTAAEKAGLPISYEDRSYCGPSQRQQQQRKVAGMALFSLNASDPEVREKSAQALGQLGPAAGAAFPAVWEAYGAERNAGVKEKLGDTLKKLNAKEADKKGIR